MTKLSNKFKKEYISYDAGSQEWCYSNTKKGLTIPKIGWSICKSVNTSLDIEHFVNLDFYGLFIPTEKEYIDLNINTPKNINGKDRINFSKMLADKLNMIADDYFFHFYIMDDITEKQYLQCIEFINYHIDSLKDNARVIYK